MKEAVRHGIKFFLNLVFWIIGLLQMMAKGLAPDPHLSLLPREAPLSAV